MKPILGIDITLSKDNVETTGKEFVVKTISDESYKLYENHADKFDKFLEKSSIPTWMSIIGFINYIYSLIIFCVMINNVFEIGIKRLFTDFPVLISTSIISFLIALSISVYATIKKKKAFKQPEIQHQVQETEKAIKYLLDELKVPADAINVDVLVFRYKIQNGKVSPYTRLKTCKYVNIELKAYYEEDKLFLADIKNVYSFSKEQIKGIKTVNKRISVSTWLKDDEPQRGKFRNYKITKDEFGYYFFSPYHILEIEKDGDCFGIYFPCYELEVFESLTGLKANKDDKV